MCKVIGWAMMLLLGVCSFCDCKRKQIPVLYLFMMTGSVLLSFGCKDCNTKSKLFGMAIGVLFFVASKFTKEAIGYGDSWIILNLGIWLGVLQLIQVLFWSGFLAGIYALFLLWKRKWRRSDTIPFVPFLTIACMGVVWL